MKRKTVYILTLILLICCKNEGPSNISAQSLSPKIDGRITGFDDSIKLLSMNRSYAIELDSSGYFSKELTREDVGNYTLFVGTETRIPLYIGDHTNLNIKISFDSSRSPQPNSIEYSGTNIDETKLLYELFLREPINQYTVEHYKQKYLPMVYSKNPSEFEAYQLEQLESVSDFISQNKEGHELNPDFLEQLKLSNLLKYNRNFRQYQDLHNHFLPQNAVKVQAPENFQNYFAKEIPENDMELYQRNPVYRGYLMEKYHNMMAQTLGPKGEYLDYFKAKVAVLKSSDFPEKIKQDFFNGFVIDYMNTESKDIKTYLEIIISRYVKDSASLERYMDFKKREATLANGDKAPDFTYPDMKGKPVSLRDFKGFVVYIDLWATWCTPCLQEMPSMKKLKETYRGEEVVFLGISFDENVNRWKDMVSKNKNNLFNGIQLSAGALENEISKDYNVNGIPHYILIGRDGNIVQKKALRPSDPKLVHLIDGLLD
ncbi:MULTISPECIES: TlpA family protein disulfide reductase [Flavobacteriaceae]|uniref:TlpA family protein disulfide reductase n=1 Tax=Flavobacteriaceae TaxID=49546 RepID=UPI00149186A3|nr:MULTISPECIES: TlpA disulfide reductase family protein [Allomuricauda]MDC6367168.1 TlpA disulfide reductase family protein [Muricauda sp. AC10]